MSAAVGGGEVCHLVVEDDAGAARHERRPKVPVDGAGDSHGVAVGRQDGAVRGPCVVRRGRGEAGAVVRRVGAGAAVADGGGEGPGRIGHVCHKLEEEESQVQGKTKLPIANIVPSP